MSDLEAALGSPEADEHSAKLQPLEQRFKYHAFISYSHQDMQVVKAIQEFLEDYALPKNAGTPAPRVHIYRDSTDIRTGHLGDQLNDALLEAAYLVVCVSQSALRSSWVMDEVKAFQAARPGSIIPVLLQGGPTDVATLLGFESRYADLTQHRPGVTRFKAREQLELVRVLAQVVGREVRTLVPWHEERRKRRLMTAVAGGLAALLLLAAAGGSYLIERQAAEAKLRVQQAKTMQEAQRAQREAKQRAEAVARKLGDGALASLSRDLFAQAAIGLARLDASAGSIDGGQYAQAARFLLPRLMTFTEAAASVGRGQLARWRASNLVRGPNGDLREIPGAMLERVWFSPKGNELLTLDVSHRLSMVEWPSMTVRGPHALSTLLVDDPLAGPRALGTVQVDSVVWAANGRPSIRVTEIMSSEDSLDAQLEGDAFSIALDADAKPLPPVTISTDAFHQIQQRRNPQHVVARHATADLDFPRLRDERSFWRTAEPRPPDDKRDIMPMAARDPPAFPTLDMKAVKGDAEQRETLARSMNSDSLASGMAVVDGHHLALAVRSTGNQSAAYFVCEFDPATRKAAWCHTEHVTATVRSYLSADYRFMLLTMTESQDDAFRLLDLSAGGVRCKVPAHPAERALTATFDASGSRLAVVTRDGEAWIYDVRKQPCEATVAARFALLDPPDSGGAISFAGRDTLIWLTDGSYVHAFDVASGLVKWSQQGGAPRLVTGERRVSVSPDGRLFATTVAGMVVLRSALTGVTLSGVFPAFRTAAGVDGNGLICEVSVEDRGAVYVDFDREMLCSRQAIPQLRTGRGASVRQVPEDPALGFGPVQELWRRTGVSDDDGKLPVPLSRLLASTAAVPP